MSWSHFEMDECGAVVRRLPSMRLQLTLVAAGSTIQRRRYRVRALSSANDKTIVPKEPCS